MLMLKKLRALRTNENVLIAVDVLLSSKGSFTSIFLMAFMASISVSNSPVNFIVYNIVRYALMGVLSIALIPLFRKYTLTVWRVSMFFSITEILAVIFLDSSAPYFPYALAFCSACESTLYWRTKTYFDVMEVSDNRRMRFKGLIAIWTQAVKVVMPVVLGVIIGSTGYTRAAFVVLGISLMQLLLTFCFTPTCGGKETGHAHKPSEVYALIQKHKTLREVMSLQFIRGLVTCGAAYMVIAQINLYKCESSSVTLGILTSISAIVAIITVQIYRKIRNRTLQQGFLAMFIPAVIALPILLIFFPNDWLASIVLYVLVYSILDSLYDSAATGARIQGILSTHLKDKSYLTEVECYGEMMLTLGRIIGLSVLLTIIMVGSEQQMMWLALFEALALLPWITMIIPKEHSYN